MLSVCSSSQSAVRGSTARAVLSGSTKSSVVRATLCRCYHRSSRNAAASSSLTKRADAAVVAVSPLTCRRSSVVAAAAAAEPAAYGAPPATNPEAYIVLVRGF